MLLNKIRLLIIRDMVRLDFYAKERGILWVKLFGEQVFPINNKGLLIAYYRAVVCAAMVVIYGQISNAI